MIWHRTGKCAHNTNNEKFHGGEERPGEKQISN